MINGFDGVSLGLQSVIKSCFLGSGAFTCSFCPVVPVFLAHSDYFFMYPSICSHSISSMVLV